MPNVGFGELLVIGLIALIVFGPNKLPEMMRSMGKALRAFQDESRSAMHTLRTGIDQEMTAAPAAPAPGVIDTADGFTPGTTPAPNGAATKARPQRAHAPRKRPSPAAKRRTATPAKGSKRAVPTKRATPQKRRSKPAPRANGKSREAHEDT